MTTMSKTGVPSGQKSGTGTGKMALSAGAILVLALLGAGAVAMSSASKSKAALSPEAFAAQMEAAALAGGGPVHHVYGGTIRIERNGATLALVADRVPPSACVSAGWKLVRKGLLSINGTMPLRVSAGKLSELCNQGDGDAVLTWIPRRME